MSVKNELDEASLIGARDALQIIGAEISEIINQELETDGEVVDQIIALLKQYKIYKERV